MEIQAASRFLMLLDLANSCHNSRSCTDAVLQHSGLQHRAGLQAKEFQERALQSIQTSLNTIGAIRLTLEAGSWPVCETTALNLAPGQTAHAQCTCCMVAAQLPASCAAISKCKQATTPSP